jgi:hypothetical protein
MSCWRCMKTGSDALGTAENESGRAKYENGTRRPRYRWKIVPARKTWKRDMSPSGPSKMSLGAQNMKTGPDALGNAKNMSGSAKYENGSRRPRYRRKRVRARETWKRDPMPAILPKTSLGAKNLKTGPDALGNAGNNFWSAKHENGTQHPHFRRKWVWTRKT